MLCSCNRSKRGGMRTKRREVERLVPVKWQPWTDRSTAPGKNQVTVDSNCLKRPEDGPILMLEGVIDV